MALMKVSSVNTDPESIPDNNQASFKLDPTKIAEIVNLDKSEFNNSNYRDVEQLRRASPLAILGDFFKDLKVLKELLQNINDDKFSDLAQQLSHKVKQLRESIPKGVA